jgi:hypothetical protein
MSAADRQQKAFLRSTPRDGLRILDILLTAAKGFRAPKSGLSPESFVSGFEYNIL